ncbi:MAG TPA: MFS transporter [Gammaproteobacteria bacterium]|nr:MFS transporter [Gammaproteobacteria bacterium]
MTAADSRPARSPLTDPRFRRLLLANVCFFMANASFYLLPKYLALELQASSQQIGWAMGIFGASALLVLPLVGPLSDRWGRRPFLLTGSALLTLSCPLFLTLDTAGPGLLGLRMLQGAAFGCWFVCSSISAVDLVRPLQRGRALALFGISTLATHGLAPSLVEVLAHRWSYALAFLVAGGFALAALWLTLRSRPGPVSIRPGAHRGARGQLALLADDGIWPLVACAGLSGVTFGTMLVFSQPWALARGIELVSVLLIAYSATSIGMRIGLGHLPDAAAPRAVLLPSLLAMGASALLMYAVQGLGLYALCGVLLGLGHSLAYPTLNTLLINRLADTEHGSGMALFVAGFNLGVMGAQLGLGSLTGVWGLGPTFAVAAAAALAALPLLWWTTRQPGNPRRQAPPAPAPMPAPSPAPRARDPAA